MKRVRRLLDGRPDMAVGSGALLLVFALLFFTGVAACVAMAGDGKQTEASQPAKKQDNRNEQNNACDQTERAGKEDNGSSGDAVARRDTGLRKDLVVYYSFDDDADGKVYDESGNGNHGVTVGDVKYELSFRGRAPRFSSNRTYILSESAGINMHDWRQVSVSVWIKTNRYTTYGRLISRGQVSGDGLSGIALQAGSGSSKASFSVGRQFQRGPAIWEKLYTSSLEPKAIDRIGKWVHLVGTFDGDRLRFYVNGKLDREVEAGGHNLKLWDRPSHKLVIGNSSMKSRMAWQDKYFDGLVDEVKIWRRKLSSEEIKHVHHLGRQSLVSRRVEARQLSEGIKLGKDGPRFEGHRADDVQPGLVAVGWYAEKLPTAKQVLLRHRFGAIPAGHRELVGRLPLTLANFGREGGSQLLVESFERKGKKISADVKCIRKYAKNPVQNAVYLRAKLPRNLPPGKYRVAIHFKSYMVGPKGEHLVELFGRPIGSMTCEFEVPGQADNTRDTSADVPEHLRRWGGLFDRVGEEIVNAPAEDVQVAKGYVKFADKGKVHNGRRVTIMAARRNYALGDEVRVIHVLEAVEPGDLVYVMGPKAVYGEYVDGKCVTEPPPKGFDINGRMLDSPAVDYNYAITKYKFDKPGEHTIQWKAAGPHDGKGLESNVLRITVGADDVNGGKTGARKKVANETAEAIRKSRQAQ